VRLDRDSPIPLWYQLKLHISEHIKRGILKPGDTFLTEGELQQKYALSRYTVRQALQELVREGWLARRRGRRSVIMQAKTPLPVTWQVVGFIEDMQSRGHTVHGHVLSQSLEKATEDIALDLKIRRDTPVVAIRRVCYVDRSPFCVDHIRVRQDLCPDLVHRDLEDKCLYSYIASEYSMPIDRTKRTLRVAVVDKALAGTLKLQPGTPVFAVGDVAYTSGHTPVLIAHTYVNETRGEFVFDLHSSDIKESLKFDALVSLRGT